MTAGRALRGLAIVAAAVLVASARPPAGDAPRPADSPLVGTVSTQGNLLVATPALKDSRFARAVLYMVRHDATGAFGLIVNRPFGEGALADVLETLGIAGPDDPDGGADRRAIRLYWGGPVEIEKGFVLHSADWSGPGTRRVDDRFALTANADVLTALAAGHGPARFLLAFGYAGWGPRQLESELARGDWTPAPADSAIVFDDDAATKWPRARKRAGVPL